MSVHKKTNPYSYQYHFEGVNDLFKTFGAGVAGSHDFLGDDDTYDAEVDVDVDTDVESEYVYAIEMYTDDTAFDELQENGEDVSSERKTGPYPKGTIIYGRFTKVNPASSKAVGIYKLVTR